MSRFKQSILLLTYQ